MKTKIAILKVAVLAVLLLNSIVLFSQVNRMPQQDQIDFYFGFDVPNAFQGGKILNTGERRNNHALDAKLGFSWTYKWWRFGVYGEIFPTIDYHSIGLQFGVPINITEDILLTPSINGAAVFRDGLKPEQIPKNETIATSLDMGWSLTLEWRNLFNSPIYAGIEGTLTNRIDKYELWGRNVDPSGYFPALWENRGFYFNLGIELTKL